tara:strand:- start:4240 stop:6369 length:2130 start_codon:yes stop_codon:yes gene_type:complete
MLDASILGKSQFLGRDGFRWWVGQIPPIAAQEDQTAKGEGIGNRYKVRIMGYHPFNEDIPNEDLPYAQVLLPVTSGSGGAGFSQSVKLQQGDTVFGFFLDGDAAQIPLIIGHFGRTSQVNTADYQAPFSPFTGKTEWTPTNSRNPVDETNEDNKESMTPPGTGGEKKDQVGVGQKIIVADTCKSNPISEMANTVENLGLRVKQLSLAGANLQNEIRAASDLVEIQANKFVGTMFTKLFDKLEDLGGDGLEKLYKMVYRIVFKVTKSRTAAHRAGVAAQTAMVPPTAFLQESIGCVAAKVVEGLSGTIEDLLKGFIDEGRDYAGCMGAQFVGAFLNTITDSIDNLMSGPLSLVAKIIAPGFNVADFLLSAAGNIEDIASFLDCNQTNTGKCPADKQYVVGGSSEEKGDDPFAYVMNAMNISKGAADLTDAFESKWGKWDIFGDGSLLEDTGSGTIPGGCYGGKKSNCTGPYIEIFGGGGSGGIAKPILGYFVDNTPGLRKLVGGVKRTASIIGAKVSVPGSGYRYPPIVNFRDKCDIGYGAVGHAILNAEGGIEEIIMDSIGENYPAQVDDDIATPTGITTVHIGAGGTGYKPSDPIVIPGVSPTGNVYIPVPPTNVTWPDGDPVDPTTGISTFVTGPGFGQTTPIYQTVVDPDTGTIIEVKVLNILRFDETLPNIIVKSDTGTGAILRPVFGDVPKATQVGIISAIDCI